MQLSRPSSLDAMQRTWRSFQHSDSPIALCLVNTWLSRTATVRLMAPTTQSWPHFPLGTLGRTNEP
eukprot:12285581-Alexandrium_andersonii.AAC.1